MKFLHVIGSLSPVDGGPPEVTRQLALAYAASGESMEVLCQDPPDSPFLRDFPCPVHALGQRWLGRYGLSLNISGWLRANLDRFDGVIMQGIWSYPNLVVRSVTREKRMRYCIFPHGALDPWFNRKYPVKYIKKLMYWPIQYPILRDAACVFFTSPLEIELAQQSFSPNGWNAVYFPNGIQEPKGDPKAEVESFYRLIPALRGRRFLLFLARVHEKKGCDLLLKAFADVVAPSIPDVDLVIAGPDPVGLQARLQELAKDLGCADRVHWPGLISGDEKWGALRAADAFVLSSHQENFGISVVESLAAGRPVLISNQVNIWRQIVEDGVGLAEDDTLSGTAELLRRWFALSREERDSMAQRALPTFRARFNLNRAVAVINSLFSPDGARNQRS
jgi:glycosyltransferase involved in cell wall biosynthesis